MCIIYWKIFQAAKFRIRRKAFHSDRSARPPATTIGATASTQPRHEISLTSDTATLNQEIPVIEKTKYKTFTPLHLKKFSKKNPNLSNHHSHDIESDNPSTFSSSASQHNTDYQLKPVKKSSSFLIKQKRGSIITTTIPPPAIQLSSTNRLKQEDEEDLQQMNSVASISSTQRLITSSLNSDSPVTVNTISNPLVISNISPTNLSHITDTPTLKTVTTTVLTTTNNTNSHNNNKTVVAKSASNSLRKKIDIKRERKATKVLGVVMGCFILCWLPFFIEETISGLFDLTINEKIISVLTWLGYLNSLLNPVIYTIFSPDFRQAFGKILFGKYRKRRRRLKK